MTLNARIYLRVSSDDQSWERQESLIQDAKNKGYYISGVYKEKASGAVLNRPKLNQLLEDLQEGDVIIAESIDRLTRLPLKESEDLIDLIKSKGAKLAVPGLIDLDNISIKGGDETLKLFLETMQTFLMKFMLTSARSDYETRRRRQKEGIELAKRNNVYRGRKTNQLSHDIVLNYVRMADKNGEKPNIAKIAKAANISRGHAYRIINKNLPKYAKEC